ncbi:MAG: DUF3124 domain-containing protein [Balneolaceae bacterium]|nr:DUF3124 domain-containing protein [Balneolaceae bacterium]
MASRTFFFILVSTLLACSGVEENRSAETSHLNTIEGEKADSLMKAVSDFERLKSSTGQTVYVPVYSHIYQLNQQKTFNLTATLSFRNADPSRTLTLTKVLYYDSQGNIVKNYLPESKSITPLASTSFVVEENDLRGGVGANFIVAWESEQPVYPPVVEAVMISTSQQQGISFVSVGRVIEEKTVRESED